MSVRFDLESATPTGVVVQGFKLTLLQSGLTAAQLIEQRKANERAGATRHTIKPYKVIP